MYQQYKIKLGTIRYILYMPCCQPSNVSKMPISDMALLISKHQKDKSSI